MPKPNENTNASASSLTPSSTSRTLLRRIASNDPEAWNRLVTLYAPLVFYWCRRYDLQDQDAADVFQEVFQAVLTHIAGFRKEQPSDTFRGWLRTITRNKIRDHFRKLGREPAGVGGTDAQIRLAQLPAEEPPASEGTAAAAATECSLFYRGLNLIRSDFEERTWRAFWRTVVDGQSPKDVSAELSMTPGAVRVAKCRVLQRLRGELGDLME